MKEAIWPPSLQKQILLPGIEHHLDAVIFFMLKDIVGFGGIVQAQSVRDDKRGIDLVLFDQVQKWLQVAVYMGLAHSEGQAFGEGRAEWHFIQEATVDAGN